MKIIRNNDFFKKQWSDFLKNNFDKFNEKQKVALDLMQEIGFGPPKNILFNKPPSYKRYALYWKYNGKFLDKNKWVDDLKDAYHYKSKQTVKNRISDAFNYLLFKNERAAFSVDMLPENDAKIISSEIDMKDFLKSQYDTAEYYREYADYKEELDKLNDSKREVLYRYISGDLGLEVVEFNIEEKGDAL